MRVWFLPANLMDPLRSVSCKNAQHLIAQRRTETHKYFHEHLDSVKIEFCRRFYLEIKFKSVAGVGGMTARYSLHTKPAVKRNTTYWSNFLEARTLALKE